MEKVNISAAAANAQKLDVTKRLSYGLKTDTRNLVDEHAKAIQLNWQIENKTGSIQTIAISSLFDGYSNHTQFKSVSALLAAIKADVVMQDGIISGVDPTALKVTSLDANRNINDFLRYVGNTPTRLVGLSAVSRKADTGAGESSNYDLKMRSVWVSPFELPVEKELNLRPLVQTGPNFTQERLNVDFQKQAFPAILSSEHFLVVQVQPNTVLSLTVYVGAQDSASQRFWRDIKAADELIRPMRSQIG